MLTKSTYEHIVLDEQGTPVIAETNTKVVEIVLDKFAFGWSAEEIHRQHPHLTLGQIHSALAYYWDHRDDLDADIAQRLRYVDGIRVSLQPTALATRLRRQGLLD